MHCGNCGAEVNKGTKFCPGCGAAIEEKVAEQKVVTPQTNKDGKATASLVLGIVSLVVPCVGFITSIIGLILGIASKERSGKRTAGIIINAIALCLIVIASIFLFVRTYGNVKEAAKEATNTIVEKDTTTDNYSSGYNSASTDKEKVLKKAKSYITYLSFSREGLIKQLEFDGYTHELAVYGADNCNANWNEQAAKKAKSYIKIMTFTHDELIKQLEYDGFTHEQAEYGVTQAGL